MKSEAQKHTGRIVRDAYRDQTHTCLPLLLGTATENTQSPSCLCIGIYSFIHRLWLSWISETNVITFHLITPLSYQSEGSRLLQDQSISAWER